MTDFAPLDVAIGLIFLILLVSSLCSTVQEGLASILNWRGKDLQQKIGAMLNDPSFTGLAQMVRSNPRIKALYSDARPPSYIPSRAFAQALTDVVVDKDLLNSVDASSPLAPFLKAASGDIVALQSHLETWFDDAMDRLSGQYRRNAQAMLLIIGFAFAALLNVDMISAARKMWADPSLRAAIVSNAEAAAESEPQTIEQIQNDIEGKTLPIGWNEDVKTSLLSAQDRSKLTVNWLYALAGWLMTAFAASLGGHFWFNVLGEALALRSAGQKPQPAAAPNPTDQA